MTVRERVPHPTTEDTVLVPSFTREDVEYRTDPERKTCTCRRFEVKRTCVKHVVLAEALLKMRSRRDLLPTEERIAGERLLGMAKRIYSKPLKRETLADSYDLALETAGYRYSTKRLVEAAKARHGKVLAEYTRRAA